MDFRLALPLRGIGGQYTVPPPVLYCQLLGDVLGDKGAAAVRDCDLFRCPSSPDLMTATVAVLNPSVDLGEAFELSVVHDASMRSG